ncbi:hypothetical protein AQUCO_00900958v1 [Aquilegia coerulea]|uniref:LOB domain-containing protein n=1 Tax=Aquilegia coerulea TaxID=218851 RepID=A0A2G5EG54_AQUCA|nr:hypothetical protein AQUCO_00900958v1 [Aquilegia coerulea]
MSASSSSSGGGGGSSGGPCGACKFLRRKCLADCIFAPHFVSEQGAAVFAVVHKVFGASNVAKLLQPLPDHKRLDAVLTICFEAQARLKDPVYGCVGNIFALQQQAELQYLQSQIATMEIPMPPPPSPPPMPNAPPPSLSMSDLSSTSTMPTNLELGITFDPQMQPTWTLEQREVDFQQYGGGRNTTNNNAFNDVDDLEAMEHEIQQRRGETIGASTSSPPRPTS